MKWLLLLALVAYTSAVVTRLGLKKIESMRTRLLKNGIWHEHLQAKQLLRAYNEIMNKAVVHNNFLDLDDFEYVSNITIGTPCDQPFVIVLDTGSSNLWIPDSSCTTTDCKAKNVYSSSKSSSYVKDGRSWSVSYGDGSNARGFLGQDTVCLGGLSEEQLKVPHQIFGQATTMNGFSNDVIDGILGLGFTALADDLVVPPVINAIQQGLLDQPIFTVYMTHNGLVEFVYGGRITYGGLDPENCGEIIAYQPLSSATYWQFKMTSISAGSYTSPKAVDVISDTGTSLMGGPSSVVGQLASVLGGEWDSWNELYFVDCAARPGPISLVIGSNTYKIDEVNYIEDVGDGSCILALFPFSMGGFGPQWILGDPFIRSYCQIHDVENQKIGFALSKQPALKQ